MPMPAKFQSFWQVFFFAQETCFVTKRQTAGEDTITGQVVSFASSYTALEIAVGLGAAIPPADTVCAGWGPLQRVAT